MEVYHIKHLREKENKSLRGISRETGHDYRTVKKYAETEDFNERKVVRKKRSKLDPYKPTIDKWLEDDKQMKAKQRHSAKAIYNRLCRENDQICPENETFPLSERSVRLYVSQKKKELYAPKAYLKLKHDGGEAQADFGEAEFDFNGRKQTLHYLVLSFPHSNGAYMQVFKGENLECLLEGLKNIFEYVGYVPTKIWFDNLKPVVKEIFKHGDRIVSDRFKQFSLHYGFESVFCNVASGNEKGNVENKVGYLRRNYFVPCPEIDNLLHYNQGLLPVCDSDMDRIHYARREKIYDLFEAEKEKMLALNPIPYDVFKLIKAKTNKYGMVSLDTNKYSVSPKHIQRQVWLKVSAQKVEIQDEHYRWIITHDRLYGKQLESINWKPYLKEICRKPRALGYTGFYDTLPKNWQDYFKGCDYHEKKESLNILTQIILENDMLTAEETLEQAAQTGECNAQTILLTYRKLIQKETAVYTPGQQLPQLDKWQPDLKSYDLLMGVRT
jgi:transposase